MTDLQPIIVPVEVQTEVVNIDVGIESPIQPLINGDYNELDNRPQINGVELIGNKTSAELHIDQTYVHEQQTVSDIWTIRHNRAKYPSVTIVDTAGSCVVGEVTYIDANTVSVRFNAAFSGYAYLN